MTDKVRIRAITVVPRNNTFLPQEQVDGIHRGLIKLCDSLKNVRITQVLGESTEHLMTGSNETLVILMVDPAIYPADKARLIKRAGGLALYGWIKAEPGTKHEIVLGLPGSRFTYIERGENGVWCAAQPIYSGKLFPTFECGKRWAA